MARRTRGPVLTPYAREWLAALALAALAGLILLNV